MLSEKVPLSTKVKNKPYNLSPAGAQAENLVLNIHVEGGGRSFLSQQYLGVEEGEKEEDAYRDQGDSRSRQRATFQL